MDALKAYLSALRDVHHYGAGVKETSYYPPLVSLLNAVGATLKPKVQCVSQLANTGAGNPDGGLFDRTQMQKGAAEPRPGQMPSRGALEVKSTKDDAWLTADSRQVTKYWERYRQVLVTNCRDFVLVGTDKSGQPVKLESYRLAPDEDAFWHSPVSEMAKAHGERFEEFLRRVMLAPVSLAEPKDVAWFLASYARDARARVEAANELPALETLKASLEEALGLRFTGEKGGHFFHSTLVQTLFYGVFSAWVLWHKEKPGREDRFSWKEAEWSLHVPMIRALFEQVAAPSKVGPLGLVEVMDWTEAVLNRVDRPAFFARFQEAEAVQYFYEPFLEAFDPELRKDLGVWYTPPEIVRYMVARVDAALKSELGIEEGLANEHVVVLDPCCGTGAYLVETLRRIEQTMREKEGPALAARSVKKAATSRVFGFEILPAPFVVSHLQLGLYLQGLGAPLSDAKEERAGVYLTNALTGWEPPKEPKKHLPFAELEEERDAAERVKREAPILVILGNPPYNGYAGMAVDEERDLSTAYRTTVKAHAPQGQGLNDLYVRFYRMAERRIARQSGQGIVCFISNYSWLDGLSFTGMRERYIEAFDTIWIDCLNGDKYKTGKLTPEGEPDPSVFSTAHNREGIQVGTAIATLVCSRRGGPLCPPAAGCPSGDVRRRGGPLCPPADDPAPGDGRDDTSKDVIARTAPEGLQTKQSRLSSSTPSRARSLPGSSSDEALAMTDVVSPVHFRHLWGKTKLARLDGETRRGLDGEYDELHPPLGLGLPFMPSTVSAGYLACPRLPELFPVSFPGVKTSRDDFLVDVDRDRLTARLVKYFDISISDAEIRAINAGVMTDTARFKAGAVRDTLRQRGILRQNIVRYCYRPFDVRWLYWEPETKLLDEKRPEYFPHVFEGNVWLSAGQHNRKEDFYQPQFLAALADHHIVESNCGIFPLCLRGAAADASLDFGDSSVGWTRGRGPQAHASTNQGDHESCHREGSIEADQTKRSSVVPEKGTRLLRGGPSGAALAMTAQTIRPNLSPAAQTYLTSLGAAPEDLFFHALAVMHAPAYRAENAGALRQDWPRIPLPASKESLLHSASLGKRIAALLDTEAEVPGVTSGALRFGLKDIAILTAAPGTELDLSVTAGWGHGGKDGVTMPGKGRVIVCSRRGGPLCPPVDGIVPGDGRPQRGAPTGGQTLLPVPGGQECPPHNGHGSFNDVIARSGEAATRQSRLAVSGPGKTRSLPGSSPEEALAMTGTGALDVYLNASTYFANVPEDVWAYTLGGYQVLKKWLSYRESALLGRALRDNEARHFMNAARRIAALIALRDELDENYMSALMRRGGPPRPPG